MEKIINSYESLFIVDVQNGEAVAKETVGKFTDLIQQNAKIIEVSKWGKRRLAYPINDRNEGYYTVITFKSAPEFPTELERLYNIDEQIMRSMTIKLDHAAVAKKEAAIANTVVAAPVAETVVDEPVAETVADEPVAETVADEPVAETVADEPVAETVADEPVAETKAQEATTEKAE
jgi:small subunit ribosomal protein S6